MAKRATEIVPPPTDKTAGNDLLEARADPQFAYTLAKGLEVLRAFEIGGPAMGNREIAVATGIARTTVARLTRTLSILGYLRYSGSDAKYRLSGSVLRLVYPLLSQLNVRQIARPLMQELANHAHGSVSLGMRDGTDIVLVETCIDSTATSARPDIGIARAIALTSFGFAYLAAAPVDEREAILREIRSDARYDWSVVGKNIKSEQQRFLEKGYCIGRDTHRVGFHAVGVPLRSAPAGELLVLNCTVAAFNLSKDQLEGDIAPRLLNLKQNVEMAVGINTPQAKGANNRRSAAS